MKTRLFFSLAFFGKIALATIGPLLVFVLPMFTLDKKLATFPVFTAIGALLAILTTLVLIIILSLRAVKQLAEIEKAENPPEDLQS